MINYLKKINLFYKNRNKINDDVLIIGRGRWSKIITNELIINFPRIKNIYIYSPNLKNTKIKNNKKIIFSNSLNYIKSKQIKHIIIANKNAEHLKYIQKFIRKDCYILSEKPLIVDQKNLTNLINKIKKNKSSVSIGMQYYYAFYLEYIKKKLIKRHKIKKIEINWFDKKNEVRNGLLKKHDLKLNFVEDIFYHFYSIFYVLLKIKNYSFQPQNFIERAEKKIKFLVKGRFIIILNFTRFHFQRQRLIKIYLYNGKKLLINFSDDKKVKIKLNNKPLKVPDFLMDRTLKFQLFFFLNQKKNDKHEELNNINNLKIFFKNLYLLKKQL